MVTLSKENYQKILEYARKCYPEEACGLVAGQITDQGRLIQEVYLLTNIDHSREHFSMDPKEQFLAVKDMRAKGLTPLGNWHSHPDTPSRPSDEDKRLAYDPHASYLILSLMDNENPVFRSFHVEGNVATDENLTIV